MGDHQQRDAAGRDINHGVDLDALLRFVEGVRSSNDALAASVVRLHERIAEMDRADRRAEQDAAMERAIDFEARLARQARLDQEIDRLRRWLMGLTVAIIVVLAILAALVWREAGLLAARALFDVYLG